MITVTKYDNGKYLTFTLSQEIVRKLNCKRLLVEFCRKTKQVKLTRSESTVGFALYAGTDKVASCQFMLRTSVFPFRMANNRYSFEPIKATDRYVIFTWLE